MKVEILENSKHYCKIYDDNNKFICFGTKYGQLTYKERVKKALDFYSDKDNKYYQSVLSYYNKNGTISEKQLACLEKGVVLCR